MSPFIIFSQFPAEKTTLSLDARCPGEHRQLGGRFLQDDSGLKDTKRTAVLGILPAFNVAVGRAFFLRIANGAKACAPGLLTFRCLSGTITPDAPVHVGHDIYVHCQCCPTRGGKRAYSKTRGVECGGPPADMIRTGWRSVKLPSRFGEKYTNANLPNRILP